MTSALQLEQDEAKYVSSQENGLGILPFCEENNEPIYSDIHLAQFFRRMVREGTLHDTFHDGSVKNTNDFVSFVKNKKNEIYFVKLGKEDVGFFWLTKFGTKSSFVNYCLYKSFWGKNAVKISKACIYFLLNKKDSRGEYILDVILGLTPVSNKLAIKLLVKSEMKVLGIIPKILYDPAKRISIDGLLSYKQRNDSPKFNIPTMFSFFLD